MEVDLVYRLNIAAFAGINLDIGVWRELLQFADELLNFHCAFPWECDLEMSRGRLSITAIRTDGQPALAAQGFSALSLMS